MTCFHCLGTFCMLSNTFLKIKKIKSPLWKSKGESRMMRYANKAPVSSQGLAIKDHCKTCRDEHCAVLTTRTLLYQRGVVKKATHFMQSIFVSFLKSIFKCISKNNLRQLPQLFLVYQGLYLHINLLAFKSERPKVHKINCRWGRLIGLKIQLYGFSQDLNFLNTCLK